MGVGIIVKKNQYTAKTKEYLVKFNDSYSE